MTLGARAAVAERILAGWAALVAIVLLAPAHLLPVAVLDTGRLGLDKPAHFVLFLVTALLASRAARPRLRHPLLLAAVASFLYGALLEGVQGLSGFRDAEVGDLVANGLGSAAGVLVAALGRRP